MIQAILAQVKWPQGAQRTQRGGTAINAETAGVSSARETSMRA